MPEPLIRVSAALLAVAFGWAAIAKLGNLAAWRAALESYRLPRPLAAPAIGAVPLVELGVAASFLLAPLAIPAALALALLGSFSLAILRASGAGDRLPCGCFGSTKARDYRALLARNAVLGVLAGAVLAGDKDARLIEGLAAPASSEVVPAAMVAFGLGLVVWMLRVAAVSLKRRP